MVMVSCIRVVTIAYPSELKFIWSNSAAVVLFYVDMVLLVVFEMEPHLSKQSTRLHGSKGDLLFCVGAWRHWLSGKWWHGCLLLRIGGTGVCSSASTVDLRNSVISETKQERWMCVGSKIHMGGQAAGLSMQQSTSILINRTYIFMHPKVDKPAGSEGGSTLKWGKGVFFQHFEGESTWEWASLCSLRCVSTGNTRFPTLVVGMLLITYYARKYNTRSLLRLFK